MENLSVRKSFRLKTTLFLSLLMLVGTCGISAISYALATMSATDNETQPLVVYYSWTGKARMVAHALKKRLSCEVTEIIPERSIGIATIVLDQFFNRERKPLPITHDLTHYNPIIIVSPIWFMKLSSPVRTFIDTTPALRGRIVYIVTTSGGPMEKKNQSIADYAKEKGLTVRGVFNISGVMKKTQAEIDRDVVHLLKKTRLKSAASGAP